MTRDLLDAAIDAASETTPTGAPLPLSVCHLRHAAQQRIDDSRATVARANEVLERTLRALHGRAGVRS